MTTLPHFICLGFQKSGTTTLFQILRQHPDVVLARDVKEPMYYRILVVDGVPVMGKQWFYEHRYWRHVVPGDNRLRGEINAGLTFSHCARKIIRDMPRDVKLIFMMCEPVARTYSAYKYFLARGHLDEWVVDYDFAHGHARAFDRYVHSVLDDPDKRDDVMRKRLEYMVLSQSNYATCVEEYLEGYPVEQMKPIFFEEFVADQHAACLDLYDFLGIEDSPVVDYAIHGNEGHERPTSWKAANKGRVAKGWNYGFREFAVMEYWGQGFFDLWSRYYGRVRAAAMEPDWDRSKILPETRAYLQEYYNDEVRRLERIFDRDLSQLWY